MSKKKLLILMGAGTSLPLGLPSVGDIDEKMREWAPLIAKQINPEIDFFNPLWASAATYNQKGLMSSARAEVPNFEQILGRMMSLAHWETPPPMGNALRLFLQGDTAPVNNYLKAHLVLNQVEKLFGHLARFMRGRCISIDFSSDAFAAYRQALTGFREKFDLGIYTLNYDTAAISAWPEAFTGFSEAGDFDPQAVFGREEWGFIYHLHGSVHHSLTESQGDRICWKPDLSGDFHDGDETPSNSPRTDNMTFPRTTLVAGGFKLDQLLADPFQTFYASFIRHVHEADAVLIAGYGFGDVHLNLALQNRHLRRRPPVIVVTKSDARQLPMYVRQDSPDPWARNFKAALRCGFPFIARDYNEQRLVSHTLEQHDFEVTGDDRAAIWHGGFETVAASMEKFTARLSGAPAAAEPSHAAGSAITAS